MLLASGRERAFIELPSLSDVAIRELASIAFDRIEYDMSSEPVLPDKNRPVNALFWTGEIWDKERRQKVGYVAGDKETYGDLDADSLMVDAGGGEPFFTSTGVKVSLLPNDVRPEDLVKRYEGAPNVDLKWRNIRRRVANDIFGPDVVESFFEIFDIPTEGQTEI